MAGETARREGASVSGSDRRIEPGSAAAGALRLVEGLLRVDVGRGLRLDAPGHLAVVPGLQLVGLQLSGLVHL